MPAVEDGRIAVCDQVAMELLWSVRDGADFRETEAVTAGLPVVRGRGGRLGHDAVVQRCDQPDL